MVFVLMPFLKINAVASSIIRFSDTTSPIRCFSKNSRRMITSWIKGGPGDRLPRAEHADVGELSAEQHDGPAQIEPDQKQRYGGKVP